MYKITITNGDSETVIHNGVLDDKALKVTGGTLTEEINSTPSFTFTMNPDNPGYSEIEGMYTRITVRDLKKSCDIFKGRVLNVSDSMDSSGMVAKDVTCAGEMDYFCDSVQWEPMYRTSGSLSNYVLGDIIDTYNSNVEKSKRFEVGECELAGLPEAVETDEGTTTMEALQAFMVDGFGGELRVRNEDGTRYIDFSMGFGEKSGTEIKLASNMKAITKSIDPSGIITRLYAFGAVKSNGKRLTLAASGHTSGAPYIDNDELIEKYGIICGAVIYDDIKGEFQTEASAVARLYTRAKKYFDSLSTETRTYQLTALDLSKIDANYDEFELYNTYTVRNRLMGISEDLRVTKRTVKLDEPQNSELSFGDTAESMAGAVSRQQTSVSQAVRQVEKSVALLNYETGGLTLVKLTEDEYSGMSAHDDSTVYFVTGGTDGVKLYLGDSEISGGGGAAAVSSVQLNVAALFGQAGKATKEDE